MHFGHVSDVFWLRFRCVLVAFWIRSRRVLVAFRMRFGRVERFEGVLDDAFQFHLGRGLNASWFRLGRVFKRISDTSWVRFGRPKKNRIQNRHV